MLLFQQRDVGMHGFIHDSGIELRVVRLRLLKLRQAKHLCKELSADCGEKENIQHGNHGVIGVEDDIIVVGYADRIADRAEIDCAAGVDRDRAGRQDGGDQTDDYFFHSFFVYLFLS